MKPTTKNIIANIPINNPITKLQSGDRTMSAFEDTPRVIRFEVVNSAKAESVVQLTCSGMTVTNVITLGEECMLNTYVPGCRNENENDVSFTVEEASFAS